MSLRLRVSLAVAAATALCFVAPPVASGAGGDFTGQQAPEIALTGGLNGATAATNWAALRGKVVCLKFWLTHCPICRRTLPDFQALQDRYGRAGVVCLGIVIDSPEGVSPYVQEKGWTFAVGCDPEGRVAKRYGVRNYPADYVVGADGVVRASNGFPREVIEEELGKVRVAELGDVPAAVRAARDAVEAGDYGEALRLAEAAAKAEGATAEVTAFTGRLQAIAARRQENRFARAEALAGSGQTAQARAELERILRDFQGTSLEARAKERLAAAR